jgi:hypothetical protein
VSAPAVVDGAALSGPRLVERPRLLHAPHRNRQLDSRSGGGRLTLGQLLDGVWEGLHADGAAECPLCRGRMVAGNAQGPEARNGARCRDCGTRLN